MATARNRLPLLPDLRRNNTQHVMIDIEALKNYAYNTIGAIHEVHKELGPGL